jgi:hypothetical protein
LERRVVQALSFLDKFVEEGEAIGELGGPFGVLVNASVDEFLQEAVLVAFVYAQGVEEP